MQREENGDFSVTTYVGDAKTLLAFDFAGDEAPPQLAGFSVMVGPPGVAPYYLLNDLKFQDPSKHAQVAGEDAYSSVNAPLHKFRWVHVPGSAHQGLEPVFGKYVYTVVPRYFGDGSLKALDPALGVEIEVDVGPFRSGRLSVGFTRGFVQSQAYVRHFGPKAVIRPHSDELVYKTSDKAGVDPAGQEYTWDQQYRWLGFTARKLVFDLLAEVEKDETLRLDVFAYDLNEPGFVEALLAVGKRARVILDDAALHHDETKPKPEDEFEQLFAKASGADNIQRGNFARYAHDKCLIVSKGKTPLKVLTGSTNFSVTGFYVNSNHVLLYDDPDVATAYAGVFQTAWDDKVKAPAFAESAWATAPTELNGDFPSTTVNFSPHLPVDATRVLTRIVDRMNAEEQAPKGHGSVLFAVMQMNGGKENPVYDALDALHARESVFSYGISDKPRGIALYQVGKPTGILVTGKPAHTQLPKPFNQVPGIGLGHQVHHKFVVCGFNGADPVVFCGSSNLALAGEEANGDNLIEIRHGGVATVFAIEAIVLVDHFEFLDRMDGGKPAKNSEPPASKQQGAVAAGWFLGTTDRWAEKYFDADDLHSIDRILFGRPVAA